MTLDGEHSAPDSDACSPHECMNVSLQYYMFVLDHSKFPGAAVGNMPGSDGNCKQQSTGSVP